MNVKIINQPMLIASAMALCKMAESVKMTRSVNVGAITISITIWYLDFQTTIFDFHVRIASFHYGACSK